MCASPISCFISVGGHPCPELAVCLIQSVHRDLGLALSDGCPLEYSSFLPQGPMGAGTCRYGWIWAVKTGSGRMNRLKWPHASGRASGVI
jgi:hypothetical protein